MKDNFPDTEPVFVKDKPPAEPAKDAPKPKKPGLFSKLGSAVGEAVGSWFAGRQ